MNMRIYDKLNAKYDLACRIACAQAQQYNQLVAKYSYKDAMDFSRIVKCFFIIFVTFLVIVLEFPSNSYFSYINMQNKESCYILELHMDFFLLDLLL